MLALLLLVLVFQGRCFVNFKTQSRNLQQLKATDLSRRNGHVTARDLRFFKLLNSVELVRHVAFNRVKKQQPRAGGLLLVLERIKDIEVKMSLRRCLSVLNLR